MTTGTLSIPAHDAYMYLGQDDTRVVTQIPTIDSTDRSPDLDNDSDDDDVAYNDYSSGEDMSDSEPTMVEHEARRKHSRGKTSRSHTGVTQRNIKQKFRALLRRFKISEDVSLSDCLDYQYM